MKTTYKVLGLLVGGFICIDIAIPLLPIYINIMLLIHLILKYKKKKQQSATSIAGSKSNIIILSLNIIGLSCLGILCGAL